MSIPTKEGDLIEWSGHLLQVCQDNVTAWKLPSDTLTALVTQHTTYKELFEKCKTAAGTKIDMQNKKDTKALFVPKLEKFIKYHLQNNDLVDNAALVELGLHVPVSTHTPWPTPSEIPSTTVKTPAIRKAEIWFKGINAKRWGRPDKTKGIRCQYLIGGPPPTRISDLLHTKTAAHNPIEFEFEEDQRGLRVYFAVCWEAGPKKRGPWSEIFMVIIP
jgi:hypothetical protein